MAAMRNLPFVILLLLVASCSRVDSPLPPQGTQEQSGSAATPLGLPNFTSLVKKQGPAVVNISTTQKAGKQKTPGAHLPAIPEDDPFYEFFRRFMPPDTAPREFQGQVLGSGFIVSADGFILTTAHVVVNAEEVTVKLTDKREFKAKVVGADPRADIALLKINARRLPVVAIGDPSKLEIGEWVLAIGSPFGFDNSVTAGIVSAKGRILPDENYVSFIQTDVAVNPGNSGGPLFNLRGEVVGVNSQIFSRTGGYMGLSFAIPIDLAMKVKEELAKHGKVSRGRLGVSTQEITPELANAFGLPKRGGALISSVEAGGPADKAGILAGDIVLKFDGKEVESSNDLPARVANIKPGTSAQIEIWRKGAVKEMQVVIGELVDEVIPERTEPQNDKKLDRYGLALRPLNLEERKELDVKSGLVVESVEGTAARAGIEPGDVILAVNDTPVSTVQQFREALQRAKKNAALLIKRGDVTIYLPLKLK